MALGALATLLALGAGELALRLLDHCTHAGRPADDAWRARIHRMNATIYRRSDDPALVYEPVPGASVPMPYGVAGFNRSGMRDDAEHATVPDGRYRVAVLGDSLVWGEEVSLGDTIPRRVQSALGASRAEVLNFGVSGYDTAQEARWYARAVRPYHPAAVVLVYCLNDAMIMSGPYNRYATPEEARRKDAQDAWFDRVAPVRAETLEAIGRRDESAATLHLIARARAVLRAATYARSAVYTDEYLLSYGRPEAQARLRESLRAIAAAAAVDGVRTHLVISPVLRSWERYHWGAVHARVAAEGRAAGFMVHDPLPVWRARGVRAEDLRLPGDSLHYGPSGSAVLGRYIAAALSAAARGASEADTGL